MKFEDNINSKYIEKLNNEKKEKRSKMHSFHRYYGKLIPAIPSMFIKEFTKERDLIFDPFFGSGTTAVEAKRLGRDFAGVEINPLSVQIAKTKTNNLNVEILEKINIELMEKINNDYRSIVENQKPYIMNRDHWFKEFVQVDLIKLKLNIEEYFNENNILKKNELTKYKEFYLVTLSAIIKNVSNADTRHVFPGISKRMRALEEEGKIKIDVNASFNRAIKSRAKAYEICKEITNVELIQGDSTIVNLEKYYNKVDLIVTNPPYISSVRYIETLKLEMYWTGLIKNVSEYNGLAHEMLGNDKLKKTECDKLELTKYDEINDIIYTMYSIDLKSAKIIGEFFNKMEQVIIKMNKILKSKKHLVMKISDSKIKKHKIETGKLLTIIAENNGFKLKDVFLDEINNSSRSLTTSRNTYSDIITHDYIIIWEKI